MRGRLFPALRIALLLVLLVAAIPVRAQAFVDHWFAGVRSGVIVTDQGLNNDGTVWQAHLGRSFGETYALELELTADELDFGIDYGLKHRSVGINHLTYNRVPLWDPYFLIGIGLIEYDAPAGVAQRIDTNAVVNIGIGGQWELIVPERVLLRADLRARYEIDDNEQPGQNGWGDAVFTIGFVVPFGR